MRIAKAIYPHLRQLADEFDVLLEKGDISELMRKCYIASKDESFTAVLEEAVRNNPVCIRLLYMEFALYFSSMFFFFISYSCLFAIHASSLFQDPQRTATTSGDERREPKEKEIVGAEEEDAGLDRLKKRKRKKGESRSVGKSRK